jgi:acetyltransferase-like isoleucine patch superfamily enzyme
MRSSSPSIVYFENKFSKHRKSKSVLETLEPLFEEFCGKKLGLGQNITFYDPSNIEIGDDLYIAYGCWFNCTGGIKIGNEVLFGPYGVIVTSNHILQDNSYRFGDAEKSPILIGDGSWLAAHVTVLAGTSKGKGVLIAANSAVRKQVDDFSIIGGVPAKKIK